jgi:hypothetical protein
VNLTVGWGAIPLGSLVAGFMLAGVGARSSLLWLAAGNVALALVATAIRTMRTAPQPEELADASA